MLNFENILLDLFLSLILSFYVHNSQYVVLYKNIVFFSVLFENGVRPTREQVKAMLLRKYPTYDKEPIEFNVEALLAMAQERDKEIKSARAAAKRAKLNKSLDEHQLRKCKNNLFVHVFINKT